MDVIRFWNFKSLPNTDFYHGTSVTLTGSSKEGSTKCLDLHWNERKKNQKEKPSHLTKYTTTITVQECSLTRSTLLSTFGIKKHDKPRLLFFSAGFFTLWQSAKAGKASGF